jgi:hypothetical protein
VTSWLPSGAGQITFYSLSVIKEAAVEFTGGAWNL